MPIKELLECRAAKVASKLKHQQHVMENVLGSLRKGVTTCKQLSNFCEHHAFVSCVETQKVDEVLVCLNSRLELMRAYLLVRLQTLMLTVSSISPRTY